MPSEQPIAPLSAMQNASPSPRRSLAAIAAALFFCAAGCDADLGSLELPRPNAEEPQAKGTTKGPAKGVPAADIDCDDLPALTPEELASLPFELSLQKPSRPTPSTEPQFEALPDVVLREEVTAKMNRLDEAYFRKTGKHLVITSGTRDAALQAKAMYKMIKLGADVLKLYRNKGAVREIKQAYDDALGKPVNEVVAAMHAVIQDQIDRGVFISAHLRAGAVDVRSRTMSAADKRAFAKSVAELGGVTLLEETKPPHYHLQIE